MGAVRRAAHLIPEPGRSRVLTAVIGATTAGVLPVFLFGAMSVQIAADLHLTAAAKGQVVFSFFAVSAVSSAWWGRLTERFGPTPLLRIGAILAIVSSLGMAIAQSFLWILPAIAVGGLANSCAQPAANALIVRHIDVRRRGFALGVKQSAIPTATLLGGLAVPAVALTVGWRWAFVGGAGVAVLALVSVPSSPFVRPPVAHRRASFSNPAYRPLFVLAVGAGLGSAMANSLGAFTTSTAVHAGISADRAGVLLAVGSALGLFLRLLSGWAADRRSGGHLHWVAGMLAGGGLGVILLAVGQPTAAIVGTLVAFGSGWSWPGVFNLAVVTMYPASPAAATGVTQTGTYAGGALGPLAMGALVDSVGYTPAWLVFAAISFLAAGVLLFGDRSVRLHVPLDKAAHTASA